MAERTNGLRSALSLPWAYDALQRLLGVFAFREEVVSQYIRAESGMRVLDIGCGTGEILNHLPDTVKYVGIDPARAYVESARARYSHRGRFEMGGVRDFSHKDLLPDADLVLALGVLHHLDNDEATALVELARSCLVDGGRLVTVDPTLTDPQSRFSEWLVSRDRGQNVRTPEAYRAIAGAAFAKATVEVRHDLLRVPYTHCLMVCTR